MIFTWLGLSKGELTSLGLVGVVVAVPSYRDWALQGLGIAGISLGTHTNVGSHFS